MAPQIDFYVLDSTDERLILKTVCRLADKVWRLGHNILVLTKDVEQSKKLDDLMWTFSQSSFLPHTMNIDNESMLKESPVVIHNAPVDKETQVLINLKDDTPDLNNAERIVEIVNQDSSVKAASREKYRYYKSQQISVKTHNISA